MSTFYEKLRKLLDWHVEPGVKVLSLYLDTSGKGEERALSAADALWEETRGSLDDDAFCERVDEVLEELPDLVSTNQREGYDGLALFACARPRMLDLFRLRFALENQLEVGHEPQTWQLAYYEEEYEPAVAVCLGPKPEIAELHVGDVVARHPLRPTHGRSLEQEARAQLHLLLHDGPRSHLIVLGDDDARARLQSALEPALRGRVIGEIAEPISADDPAFLRSIHRVQQAYERRSEAEGVRALLAARQGPEAPVAAGPGEVIDAINQGRIQKLYILQSFEAPGWECDVCDRLGVPPAPPHCTACGASVAKVMLEQHLIQQARACGAEIETVYQSEELSALGAVAAELLPR